MHRGRRVVATLTALAVGPIVLLVPVVTGPLGSFEPVTPVVTRLALDGVDEAALAASPTPAPHVHDHEGAVDDAAYLDPAPAAGPSDAGEPPTADRHAGDESSTDEHAVGESPTDGGSDVAERLTPAVVTAPTETEPFSLVAVDFAEPAPEGTAVQVRVREDGAWSGWTSLAITSEHGPDPGTAEAEQVRYGTEPLLTSLGADGVQVRIDSPEGTSPSDPSITLIDPQQVQADAIASPTPVSTAVAAGDPLRPAIITRAQWGADESLRDRAPIYTGPIKAGFVHHTASTSNYTPAQSTAQVRALYAYFTRGLGYSDIAYNFIVDRYGRLYEGRAGGIDKNVLGAHTAGFNANTFAVSALGNFDTYRPTATEINGIKANVAQLLAWKLSLAHVDALSTASLVSNSGAGTSKYAPGTIARVPAVSGHRDIGSTACPGRYLYEHMSAIRTMARTMQRTQLFAPTFARTVMPYGSTGTTFRAALSTAATWRLEIFSTCRTSPVRVLTGSLGKAGTISVVWDQKAADGSPALPGEHRAVLSAVNGSQVAYPVAQRLLVTSTSDSPAGPCPQLRQIEDTDAAAASVRAARLAAPTSRTVVIAPAASAATALVAAPLASVRSAALLLSGADALPTVVAAEITRRKATTAFVVGSSTQVRDAVVSRLRQLGVTTVVRVTGSDLPSVAASVATTMNVRGRAVAVSFGSHLDVATAAAAGAAVAKRPLLVVTRTSVPAATAAVRAKLGLTSVIVAGPAAAVSDSVVASLGATRVAGQDDSATSFALARALAPNASSVTLHPVVRSTTRAVSASTRRPVLLVGSSLTAATTWLRANSRVTRLVAVAPSTVWGASTQAALLSALSATTTASPSPSPSTSPVATPTSTAALAPSSSVPASFTFTGSGYGHGVGMSQYGARGMALEGRSAADITAHYYTGSTLAAVRDDAEIKVNLLYRASAAVLRGEPLAAGGGRVEVTLAGATPVLGTAADVFTVVPSAGKVQLRRTTAGTTTVLGTGASVTVRWAGTRTPGKAGTVPTVLNVATSTAGLASAGHRYRYGTMTIASTAASPKTLHVVNQVRIHDEYLRGIAEVPSSWPAAALQAQVLAARSYAITKVNAGVRSACLCHVDDGGGPYYDQTFAGWTKESDAYGARWRAAVEATAPTATTGQVITSGGKVITAFYYSASGGRTQNSEDVWVSTLPYARSVDDRWSLDPSVPWSSWIPRVRSQSQVAAAFGLPDVVRVGLRSRTVGGGVDVARAWSKSGSSASISGETLRARLSLPSTWVSRVATQTATNGVASSVAAAKTSTSKVVVLATNTSVAGIGIAANLAAQKGWPILITSATSLSPATRAELVRRAPTTVYVVGTSAQMPAAIVSAVDAVSGTVVRVTGADDAAVSVRAAQMLAPAAGSRPWVAPANDAELLTIASAAASRTRRPFLVVPSATAGSASVTSFVRSLGATSIVVGSTAQISSSVATSVSASTRAAGADDADTAGQVLLAVGGSRVVLGAPAKAWFGLVAAPGAPVLIAGASLPSTATRGLQRGVSQLVVTPSTAAEVVTSARLA